MEAAAEVDVVEEGSGEMEGVGEEVAEVADGAVLEEVVEEVGGAVGAVEVGEVKEE